MRKSIIVILAALVIISIIIPASAYIAPINATWVPPGNTYSGWVPSRAIDGNTGTQAVMDSGGRIRLYFASGAENATITSCDVFARPDAGGILGFTEANHTNALWRKSYPAGSGWGTFTFPVAQTGKYLDIGQEDGGWLYLMEVRCSGWNATYSDYGDPTFTGYPLDGYSPLEVSFTIQNTTMINATGTSWTFGDGQTSSSTTSIVNHTYQNPGIYTVSMQYFNQTGGSVTITRTNYVLASIPSGMIVNLDVKNAITGALIQDSTVSIRNVTSGVWRNTTAPTGLVYFSTTDPGYLYPLSQNQTITLAANKSGYRDASETFAIPYNNYRARLFLMPTSRNPCKSRSGVRMSGRCN